MAGIDSGRARLVIHRMSFAPRAAIVVGGLGIHALAAVLTDPMPTSDGRTYLDLAVKLAAGEPYISWDGHRAFWPPGLPLFLVPFIAAFGSSLSAITLTNAVLFLLGAWAITSMSRTVIGERGATIALLLYCLWPSHVLSAGLASKENLTSSAISAGFACPYEL